MNKIKPSVDTNNFSSDFIKTDGIKKDENINESILKEVSSKDNEYELSLTLNSNQVFDTNYEYNFGINSIEILNKQPLSVSGYISPEIEIKNSSFIRLSVLQTNPDVSQEFYIIDNNKEYNIQPKELPQVIKEKIFFNFPIRFNIDFSKEIIIYKNNIKTDITYSQINELDTKQDEYTITYTPTNESYQYKPKSEKIKIKLIQRHIGSEIPSTIKSISVVCYGGNTIWNI